MAIEKRVFGRTGHMSSAVVFGAAALARVDQGVADRVLDLLIEQGFIHRIERMNAFVGCSHPGEAHRGFRARQCDDDDATRHASGRPAQQRRRADGDGVGAKRERLGHVGAGADAARNDELHLAVHAEVLERLHRRLKASERWNTDMLDEDFLGGSRATLHAVENDDIGAGLGAGIRAAAVRTGKVDPAGIPEVKSGRVPVFANFAAFAETLT